MNEEIKAAWVAALRSGEYEQGTEYLSRDGKFCCLGVLCDLAVKAQVIVQYTDYTPYTDYGQGDEEILPSEVASWAGLTGENRQNPVIVPDIEGLTWNHREGHRPTLAELNDGGTPFGRIAEVIEAQL